VSKNFLASHQLDVHLWTEFLCAGEYQNESRQRVSQ
jgi:hypothetical protein